MEVLLVTDYIAKYSKVIGVLLGIYAIYCFIRGFILACIISLFTAILYFGLNITRKSLEAPSSIL
jgi:hypothetical protein